MPTSWFCFPFDDLTSSSQVIYQFDKDISCPLRMLYFNNGHALYMIFPRNGGVVKAESILFSREGKDHAKDPKTYTAEFKREAVRLAQMSGEPITQIARETFVSQIPQFINGARRWQNTVPKHSQEVGIKLL